MVVRCWRETFDWQMQTINSLLFANAEGHLLMKFVLFGFDVYEGRLRIA